MKKTYLISIAIMLLAIHSPAQAAKCKYEINSTDKFTKVKTQKTKWASLDPWSVIIGSDSYLVASISAALNAESRTLGLQLIRQKSSSYRPRDYELQDVIVIPEGSRLLILMADDTILELPALHEVRASAQYSATNKNATEFAIKSIAEINFALDGPTTEALMKQEAKRIRVEAQDRNYDVIIDEALRDNFQWALGCIQ
jgi:hypothetical protein